MTFNNLTSPGMEPQAGDLVENTEAQTPEESVGFIMGGMAEQFDKVVEDRTKQMKGEDIEVVKERVRKRCQEISDSTRGTGRSGGSLNDLLVSASEKAGIVAQIAKGFSTEHEELREGFLSVAKTLDGHMSGLKSVNQELETLLNKKDQADKELFDNE